MHLLKTGRTGLLAAIVAVVAVVGVLPMFGGGSAYGANSSTIQSTLTQPIAIGDTPPFRMHLVNASTFPIAGSVRLGPKTGELMNYSNINTLNAPLPAACNPAGDPFNAALQLCIRERAKQVVGGQQPWAISTKVNFELNLKQSAARSEFIIPGTPVARTTAALGAGAVVGVDQPPFDLLVNDTSSFPTLCPPTAAPNKCQILVSNGAWGDGDKDGAEIMTYDTKLADRFHIIERGPGKVTNPPQIKKAHPIASKVKLATVTTAPVANTVGLQTTLTDGDTVTAGIQNITNVRGGCTMVPGETFATCPPTITPFAIQLSNTTGWPPTEFITINHQDLQTSNLLNGQSGEFFQYDLTSCGTLVANQVCIIKRAQQPTNRAYVHRPTGYPQPSMVATSPPTAGTPGVTKVSLHFQMSVKSTAGFFPAGNLLVCDAGNPLPLASCELIGHNNAADKIKPPSDTQFHMTERCAPAANFNKVPAGCGKAAGNPTHAIGSVVTGADAFLACRNGNSQPGVDTDLGTAGIQEPATQIPGTSVGITAVCYTETQPKSGGNKDLNDVPGDIVGQDLNVINSIAGQPFLSTGGFCHVILGAVGTGPSNCTANPQVPPAPFDTNGPANGTLVLGSACITDFTPGTNLQVNVTLTTDKVLLGTDPGTIRVVLDTIHDNIEGNLDDCNDPAGTDVFTSTTYDSVLVEPGNDGVDDDTDRDGCLDERELRPVLNQGGIRDPWNPYDWYDINHDGAVSVTLDLLQIALANGAGNPNYLSRKDRGVLNYGPFGWNKSAPNGNIDITSDVLGAAQQVSQPCLGHDPDTTTPAHETYNVGTAWPTGDRPWYIGIAGNGVPNH